MKNWFKRSDDEPGLPRILWLFVQDVVLEPLLLAIFLIILLSRVQTIMNDTALNYSFGEALALDMETNAILYVLFAIVFFIWVALKAIKRREEIKLEREQRRRYEQQAEEHRVIMESLQQIVGGVITLIEEVRSGKASEEED